jgi:hypothetical protein
MMEFLVIMTLDGREVFANPRHIVSIAEARQADDPGKHYTDDVRCVISLVDGAHISTREECDDVERRLHTIMEERLKELRK